MRMWRRGIGIILFITLAAFVLSGLVMVLWNFTLVPALEINPLTYWQAMALLVLMRILVGGFRFGPGHRGPRKWGKWRRKWSKMSEEDREKWKAEWRKRCTPRETD